MRSLVLLFVCCGVAAAFLGFELGTLQSAGAQGILMCNGKPYTHAKVKFWEVDIGPIPDDFLMETEADQKGCFKIQGNQTETGWIEPKLTIFHDCDDETVECLRKLTIFIPQNFITQNSTTPERYFDIGVVNLAARFGTGDDHDCNN
ncbi:unnamed protein product, partial [Mesorhabditis spiculigera]